MLTNWYTLQALTRQWSPFLSGRVLVDAYSQTRGTLVLVFDGHSLTISLQSPHRHLFLDVGSSRARKNVADVFPDALGRRVASVTVADRDRLVYIHFDDDSRMIIVPFGPRANVYWCPDDEHVETFLTRRPVPNGRDSDGMPVAPAPRPAPGFVPPGPGGDEAGTPLSKKSLAARLPLFPKTLIREVWARCEAAGTAGGTSRGAWAVAETVVQQMEAELCAPSCAWVYHDGEWPEVLSLVQLTHLVPRVLVDGNQPHTVYREEAVADLSEAVRRVSRRRMGLTRFRSRYEPLVRAVAASVTQAERSLQRMEEELQKPSRADEWEAIGHTLMAQIHRIPHRAEQVTLPDIMTGEGVRTITLKPELDAVRNAEWYYDRARRVRESRAHATSRLEEARQILVAETEFLQALLAVGSAKELDMFEKKNAGRLSRLRGQGRADAARPYRRYALADGYDVWVGRNARENDLLTQRDSRPWDLWLHARGVAGSHVVLRLKGRSVTPPAPVVEKAAGIAAWWSKARTSRLAPVIVTERKYVRKPRGAAVGAVLVEREDVIMVEPALP